METVVDTLSLFFNIFIKIPNISPNIIIISENTINMLNCCKFDGILGIYEYKVVNTYVNNPNVIYTFPIVFLLKRSTTVNIK
ncbi:hypothetical protein GCM10008904_12170 [Paraclostridium ghonii]